MVVLWGYLRGAWESRLEKSPFPQNVQMEILCRCWLSVSTVTRFCVAMELQRYLPFANRIPLVVGVGMIAVVKWDAITPCTGIRTLMYEKVRIALTKSRHWRLQWEREREKNQQGIYFRRNRSEEQECFSERLDLMERLQKLNREKFPFVMFCLLLINKDRVCTCKNSAKIMTVFCLLN